MPIKSSAVVRVNIEPVDKLMDSVLVPVTKVLIEGAQDIVVYAVKNHPYTDQSGHNTRSIGWAVSPNGNVTFGPLTTGGSGDSVQGDIVSDRDVPTVIIAGISAYSGWLEVGTSKMPAFPYLMPAFEAIKDKILNALKGVWK